MLAFQPLDRGLDPVRDDKRVCSGGIDTRVMVIGQKTILTDVDAVDGKNVKRQIFKISAQRGKNLLRSALPRLVHDADPRRILAEYLLAHFSVRGHDELPVPAQSEVEAEPAGNFPGILDEQRRDAVLQNPFTVEN